MSSGESGQLVPHALTVHRLPLLLDKNSSNPGIGTSVLDVIYTFLFQKLLDSYQGHSEACDELK
jgi:hypothetical protein